MSAGVSGVDIWTAELHDAYWRGVRACSFLAGTDLLRAAEVLSQAFGWSRLHVLEDIELWRDHCQSATEV